MKETEFSESSDEPESLENNEVDVSCSSHSRVYKTTYWICAFIIKNYIKSWSTATNVNKAPLNDSRFVRS